MRERDGGERGAGKRRRTSRDSRKKALKSEFERAGRASPSRGEGDRAGTERGQRGGRRLRGPWGRTLLAAPGPACGRPSSHIPSGFPHIRHQRVPKAPAFPAPLPRQWLEKLFFTPSWSLICCGKRKRLLLNEGLRGGRGGGAGDCVSRSCAPGTAGDRRGGGRRARAGRAGGSRGAEVGQAGLGQRGPGSSGKATVGAARARGAGWEGRGGLGV